jgi:hypothetical protein
MFLQSGNAYGYYYQHVTALAYLIALPPSSLKAEM